MSEKSISHTRGCGGDDAWCQVARAPLREPPHDLSLTHSLTRSKLEKDQRGLGETTSRKDLGLDWTFTANGLASYWLQSISMSMARTLAESIVAFIGGNQEADGSQTCSPFNVN